MEITSAKQSDIDSNVIIAVINGVTSWVPKDPANSDYAEIMRQVDAGELTIAPADEEE